MDIKMLPAMPERQLQIAKAYYSDEL
uniref:Uncharacterized protein n=1 Tax=Ralstonia solanacearum TaxID=305 RepID=A0A0S4WNB7_RALSL|nr:protein of unknown function [Ralstonia solanacearum]